MLLRLVTTISHASPAFTAAVLALALCILNVCQAKQSTNNAVIELHDDNFEQLTQATTGSTTGDWFIEFYSPACVHCSLLAPTWEELAVELKETNPVAKVDITRNPLLKKRFNIRSYPTLILLRKGTMYKYDGQRVLEKLKSFVQDTPQKAIGSPIPPPVSSLDILLDTMRDDWQHLADTKKIVVLFIFLVGSVLGIFIGFALARFSKSKQD